jgi:hypothetical protein
MPAGGAVGARPTDVDDPHRGRQQFDGRRVGARSLGSSGVGGSTCGVTHSIVHEASRSVE